MKIGIIGLGYVGLPLAIEFGKIYPTVGYDINQQRISELKKGLDRTGEAGKIIEALNLTFTGSVEDLQACNIFIITVPTPIDSFKKPDLSPLLSASGMVGSLLKPGDMVIYESTVYPGCTEEDCVPVLEKESKLKFNIDFFCGYSPERINPGDKKNTLTNILKITSGSTPESAVKIDNLYKSIIKAGTYLAPSIKVAEAAKLIENCQRDVNISFANELSLIFDRLGIETGEVLRAASTKWNFLPFTPGLVGGHCISVDPYYMIHKAESVGYHPDLIGAGRRINDSMGVFVAAKSVKLMIKKGIPIKGAKALILGVTFKENCPDIRNTRVIDIYHELADYGMEVTLSDSRADVAEVREDLGISLSQTEDLGAFDLIILAVPHLEYLDLHSKLSKDKLQVVFDIRSAWPRELVDSSL